MLDHTYDAEDLDLVASLPFLLVHAGALIGPFFVGVTPGLVGLAILLYVVRMWAITAGYHRYFSHRSFKTSRVFQFVLALLGTLAIQKGPLWWGAHHREHHRHSDKEGDVHSPSLRGFLWAHVGWFLCRKYDATDYNKIKDLAKYPELRWLNRYHLTPPLIAGALLWAFFGTAAFVWGGLVSTVMLWHGTFTINSLCHVFGRRRFATTDTSKNSFLLAIITLGEGWHNNHHYYPGSTRQGFYWWEIDPSYYSLKMLAWLGIVWDVRGVPQRVLDKGRRVVPRADVVPRTDVVPQTDSAMP